VLAVPALVRRQIVQPIVGRDVYHALAAVEQARDDLGGGVVGERREGDLDIVGEVGLDGEVEVG